MVGSDDGVPTHAKLETPADVVIANGCDCEPLVYSSSHLLVQHANDVIDGLQLAMQATGAHQGIVAFISTAPVLEAAVRAAAARPGIDVFHAPAFYPVGDECVLAYEATGRLAPSYGSAASVGVLILSVETLYNLSLAARGVPVTQRTVTVAGEVARPQVLRLPLGARASDAIQRAGGPAIERFRVLMGGPMHGGLADDACEPITKTTAAVIVLPPQHIQVQKRTRSLSMMLMRARSACFHCQECTDSCPRYLAGQQIEPHKIMRAISYSMDSLSTSITSAVNCNECGLCDSYVCKMGISPRVICHEIKGHLAAMGWQPMVPPDFPTAVRSAYAVRHVPLDGLAARLGVTKYIQGIDLPKLLEAVAETGPPIVQSLAVLMLQHVGAAAVPTVGVGEVVQLGQVIGEIPEGKLGARVHASLVGTVGSVCGWSVEIEAPPECVADPAGQITLAENLPAG